MVATRYILFSLFMTSACSLHSQEFDLNKTMKNMETQQKARDREASQKLVIFMSLNTMFPDKQVRALAAAAGRGNIRTVNKLVESGVDVNSRGTSNATPLYWAMHNLKGFRRLLELGADPNVVFDDGGSVMHWAVLLKDKRILETALEFGGNPNLVAARGETPLFKAMTPDGKDKVDLLLRAGADLNVQNENGDAPLIIAAYLGQFDIVYKLLEQGADYNIRNSQGKNLLDVIDSKKGRLIPEHELTQWMYKVIAWLETNRTD